MFVAGVKPAPSTRQSYAEPQHWLLRKYKDHTCAVSVTATTMKPWCAELPNKQTKYCAFSATSMLKPMLAPALVPACILNSNLKPKDAKRILQNHVVRDLPGPFLSQTLKIAKTLVTSGGGAQEVGLSKLRGHAQLLTLSGHHCTIETTDYDGMKKVSQIKRGAVRCVLTT